VNRKDERDAWTQLADQALAPKAPARGKFGNQSITVDGYRFDSKKEAARYQELKYAQAAGKIADLRLQPVYPLQVVALFRIGAQAQIDVVVETVGVFTADFEYTDLGLYALGEVVTEDVKGGSATKTEAYRLRKKIAEAIHGMVVREL